MDDGITTALNNLSNDIPFFLTFPDVQNWMVISTGVVEASSVGVGRCAYRICFQPSPLNSLTAKSERSK